MKAWRAGVQGGSDAEEMGEDGCTSPGRVVAPSTYNFVYSDAYVLIEEPYRDGCAVAALVVAPGPIGPRFLWGWACQEH